MMFANATNLRPAHTLLRILTASLAVTLLVGAPLLATRAQAQAADDKAVDKNGNDTPKLPSGPLSVGDDTIDPKQPLKPGFLVNVSVVDEESPSGTYLIDPAGNLSIKYQGIMTPIPVLGLTPAEAEKAIAKFLKAYIKNPQVTVTIITVPRPSVFVAGALSTTGQIQVAADTTLVDVLSKAVWTANADLTQVRVTHKDKDGESVIKTYNFDKFISARPPQQPDETQNPVLHDKDRIFVPYKSSTARGTVSVFGQVLKPQREIPLPDGQALTVREAINLVGGTSTDANRKSITIRRPSIDKPLVIDLDKAEQGDPVYNIELKADDSIYVEKLENNAYININGGFVKPGKFIYDKRTTLTQAVGEAGGPAPFAKAWKGVIYRHPDDDPKHSRVIAFNFVDISNGKKPDIELQPGDTIWISTGIAPKPGFDVFSALSALSSATYLYNSISGRYTIP